MNKQDALIQLILNSKSPVKRKCMRCSKPRNHAGVSRNVFFCNDCKPAKFISKITKN